MVLPSSGLLCALIHMAILPQFIPPPLAHADANSGWKSELSPACGWLMRRDLDRHTPASEHHQEGEGGAAANQQRGLHPKKQGTLRFFRLVVSDVCPDLGHFTEVPGPQLNLLGVCGEWKVSVQALQTLRAGPGWRLQLCVLCPISPLGAVS